MIQAAHKHYMNSQGKPALSEAKIVFPTYWLQDEELGGQEDTSKNTQSLIST